MCIACAFGTVVQEGERSMLCLLVLEIALAFAISTCETNANALASASHLCKEIELFFLFLHECLQVLW